MASTDPLHAIARDLSATTDLYALLDISPDTPKADIHRAWRRKGLKYHPDKAGANFDPAAYELFERAREVLTDDGARAAYDASRAAAAMRAQQAEMMGKERRRFKDELEAAERDAGVGASFGLKKGPTEGESMREAEVLREAGRRREEARDKAMREAQDKQRRKEDERIAELESRLKEKADKAKRKAERKAREKGEADARKARAATKPDGEAAPQPDKEWRGLLGSQELPFEKRPIYAYTIARLKAAEAARLDKLRAQGLPAELSVPQWDEVKDPEVKKFIPRVPRFKQADKAEDVEMAESA